MAERTSYAPGAPSWADLTVPDLEAALTFYGGLFGWEFEDQGEEAGHYHQALKDGRRVAGIGPNQPGTPPMAFWTTYLTGTDVDAHAREITAAGGNVAFGPLQVLEAGRMVAAQDPTGAMFGIWEPGEHKGAQLHDEHAALSWNELMTRDLEGAVRFYGSLFDYTFEPLPDEPEGYRVLKLGGDYVGGIWSCPRRRRRTGWRTSSSTTSTPASSGRASSAASWWASRSTPSTGAGRRSATRRARASASSRRIRRAPPGGAHPDRHALSGSILAAARLGDHQRGSARDGGGGGRDQRHAPAARRLLGGGGRRALGRLRRALGGLARRLDLQVFAQEIGRLGLAALLPT